MDQRVYEVEFMGQRLRFVGAGRRSTALFIPLADLCAALDLAMAASGRRSWETVLRRRLAAGVDPSARQRAFLDGRIVPTVSSGFVMMLCHSLGRLVEGNPSLRPAAEGFGAFRRVIYRNLGLARRRLALGDDRQSSGPGRAS